MNLGESAQQQGLAAYLRWVHRTSRIAFDVDRAHSAVVAIWSETIFCLLAAALDRRNVGVFVLDHPGADRMVTLIERLGFPVIMASPGGADGVREARAWLAVPNRLLAITLDGPAGPLRVAKPGVVRLARMFRAPLAPIAVSADAFLEADGAASAMPYGHGRIAVTQLEALPQQVPVSEAIARLQRGTPDLGVEEPLRGRTSSLWQAVSRSWVRACRAPIFTDQVIIGAGLKEV